MTTKKLIGFFLLFVTIGFTSDNTSTITPGIGTSKIKIGQKIKSVFLVLGKNDDFSEGIMEGDDFAIHINRYIYSKLGLTIITHVNAPKGEDLKNAVIDNIIFEKPASVKTKENLFLGVDSKEKLISIYSNPDKIVNQQSKITYYHYLKKGISFELDNVTNTISKIEVYKINGYSEID